MISIKFVLDSNKFATIFRGMSVMALRCNIDFFL